MVDSVVIHQLVDFRRAHSGMYFLFHEVEHSGVDFSAAADTLNLFWCLYEFRRRHKVSVLLIKQNLAVHVRKFLALRHNPITSVSHCFELLKCQTRQT